MWMDLEIFMLSEQTRQEPCDFTLVWAMKLNATNKHGEQRLMDTDRRPVVTRGAGGVGRGEGAQRDGNERKFNFGWR